MDEVAVVVETLVLTSTRCIQAPVDSVWTWLSSLHRQLADQTSNLVVKLGGSETPPTVCHGTIDNINAAVSRATATLTIPSCVTNARMGSAGFRRSSTHKNVCFLITCRMLVGI